MRRQWGLSARITMLSRNLRLVNSIIAYNSGSPAIYRPDCYLNYFRNNAFWGNDSLFGNDQCSSRHRVEYMNVNGDSCDQDYNIYLDPQFVDWELGDYHLTEGSPLIDAGIAGAIFNTSNDPDNTPPDIGAYYFDQTSASDELPELPSEISTPQNYPNPFSGETTIEFEVPEETHATLELFDITGRHVRTLFDDVANGRNSVHVSMNGLASGIYIYRLNASGYTLSHKMLLIR
ncbi:MAG: T9SS type A sorting domain-containing protein [bacterium]|nr:T9SS type A sorting domain-containing protein [bacterium]